MNMGHIARRRGVRRSPRRCPSPSTYLLEHSTVDEKKEIAGTQLGAIRGAARAAREACGTPVIVQG